MCLWWLFFYLSLITYTHPFEYSYGRKVTRDVTIKQGIVRGLVVKPRWNVHLPHTEVYLGLPYAAAPVGDMRFMPPNSAPQWHGVRYADSFGPVCPQQVPDLHRMSGDRRERYKRLRQHLVNESEDCLYLNIYAPIQGIFSFFLFFNSFVPEELLEEIGTIIVNMCTVVEIKDQSGKGCFITVTSQIIVYRFYSTEGVALISPNINSNVM